MARRALPGEAENMDRDDTKFIAILTTDHEFGQDTLLMPINGLLSK
jgi:hypothetical protein